MIKEFIISIILSVVGYIFLINNGFFVSDAILIITIGGILWYSAEAREMQKATNRQIDLAHRPVIDLFYSIATKRFTIKNTGLLTAYNIDFKPFSIGNDRETKFEVKIFDVNALMPNMERQTFCQNTNKHSTSSMLNMEPIFFGMICNELDDIKVEVSYQNIKRYKRIFLLKSGGVVELIEEHIE